MTTFKERKIQEFKNTFIDWNSPSHFTDNTKSDDIESFLSETIEECRSFNGCELNLSDSPNDKLLKIGWNAHHDAVEAKFNQDNK